MNWFVKVYYTADVWLKEREIMFWFYLNQWLANKSWQAAIKAAKKITDETNAKVFIILINGDFCAITKKELRLLYRNNPKMQRRSFANWLKCSYEFNTDRYKGNTTGIRFAGSAV